MMTKRGIKAGVVIESLIILLGFGLIVKGAMLGAVAYKVEQLAQYADGEVTGTGAYHYGLIIKFDAPQTGVIFKQDGLFPQHAVGDKVPVFYDPARPQKAYLNEFMGVWFDTFALALVGLILVGWGFRMRANRSL